MKRFSLFLFIIFCCLSASAQTSITIDLIKNDSIVIDSNYKEIIRRQAGWKYYGYFDYSNMFFNKDTLMLSKFDECIKFKDNGRRVSKAKINGKHYTSVSKYKFENDSIGFSPEWMKGRKRLNFGSERWDYYKIIKATNDYLIIEMNIHDEHKRIIYVK